MTASFDSSLTAPQAHSPHVAAERFDYPARELSKGEILYRLGDPAEAVFRVEEGLLKQGIDLLNGKERITTLAGPGDFIGTISPAFKTYQETAEALSHKVVVRVVPSDRIEAELKDALHVASGVQMSRLREVLEDTELPVNARIARTLLRLGNRFGHVTDDDRVRLTLPITHENFAAMIGAARETTTAIIGEMRNDGLIAGTRGRYSFDHTALSDFAVSAAF